MFEKTPDDAYDADVFRQAGDAGAQAASVANEEVDPYPRHGSAVERLDDFSVFECVHLELYVSSTLFGMYCALAFDPRKQGRLEKAGSRGELLIVALGHETRCQVV